MLLTNNGKLYRSIMNQDADMEKEYLLHTHHPITDALIQGFTQPFQLGRRITLPATLEILDFHTFKVVLQEGINRQIRRICAKHENQVKKLVRIRFGNHLLGDLPCGDWKEIDGF